jgi:hypothetical protein
MKVYTYSQARQNLAEVLNQSKGEAVIIRRRSGDSFTVTPKPREGSPFNVPGVKTAANTADILNAVRESRSKTARQRRSR